MRLEWCEGESWEFSLLRFSGSWTDREGLGAGRVPARHPHALRRLLDLIVVCVFTLSSCFWALLSPMMRSPTPHVPVPSVQETADFHLMMTTDQMESSCTSWKTLLQEGAACGGQGREGEPALVMHAMLCAHSQV